MGWRAAAEALVEKMDKQKRHSRAGKPGKRISQTDGHAPHERTERDDGNGHVGKTSVGLMPSLVSKGK